MKKLEDFKNQKFNLEKFDYEVINGGKSLPLAAFDGGIETSTDHYKTVRGDDTLTDSKVVDVCYYL